MDDTYGAVSLAPKGPGLADLVAGCWGGGLALRVNGSLLAWGNDPLGTTCRNADRPRV